MADYAIRAPGCGKQFGVLLAALTKIFLHSSRIDGLVFFIRVAFDIKQYIPAPCRIWNKGALRRWHLLVLDRKEVCVSLSRAVHKIGNGFLAWQGLEGLRGLFQ